MPANNWVVVGAIYRSLMTDVHYKCLQTGTGEEGTSWAGEVVGGSGFIGYVHHTLNGNRRNWVLLDKGTHEKVNLYSRRKGCQTDHPCPS